MTQKVLNKEGEIAKQNEGMRLIIAFPLVSNKIKRKKKMKGQIMHLLWQ